MDDSPARRFLPPPLWALLMLPFGITVGFASVAVPFVLRARGLPMTLIATVTQAAALPHIIKPFWSPLLDSGPRRRTWFFGSIVVTAVALAVTALTPPSLDVKVGAVPLLWIYTGTLFVAQAAVATSGSAVLALMALTVPDERRGAASGWQTAGNLAGTAVGGALVAWMINHLSTRATAIVLAAICLAAALPALLIDEVPPPRRSVQRLLRDLLGDVWRTLRSREGWTGMVICLSPVGAGALTNLFSALARDYAPDDATAEHLVVVVAGVFGGVVNMAGALLGGVIADRMNRRLAYAVCGALAALCAVAMVIAPATPRAFTVGCLGYQLANGLCYAVFYAFVLELVGKTSNAPGGAAASTVTTQLALYIGASNLAASYVTYLDGWGYDRLKTLAPTWGSAGRVGMLGMDALTTFVGLAVLGAMTLYVRRAAQD
ncbi:MAG TPA: MFS transporter [Polyangiaceae bacterium]|nr:MFS transporter [Polyangiaceae bacterium]